jgi:hypothetical protein
LLAEKDASGDLLRLPRLSHDYNRRNCRIERVSSGRSRIRPASEQPLLEMTSLSPLQKAELGSHMPKLNYGLIRLHVAEAREELQRIEAELLAEAKPDKDHLQVWFDHAFHHLNTAWNARHATDKQEVELSDENFNRWGRFPRDIKLTKVDLQRPKRSKRSARAKGRRSER